MPLSEKQGVGSSILPLATRLFKHSDLNYDQNYDFDLNEKLLTTSESENLLFSSIEELDPLEKAKFFDAQLSDFYKKAVQSALLAEGIHDSKIDGQYGPGTRKAISEWQINNNYEPTGFMTIPQQSELIKNYLKPLFDNCLLYTSPSPRDRG